MSNAASGGGSRGGGNSGGGRGSGGMSTYQRQLKGSKTHTSKLQGQTIRTSGTLESADRQRMRLEGDAIDQKFGFDRLKDGPPKLGWLLNFMPITMADEHGMEKSGLDMYFVDKEGANFKASIFFRPYFYLVVGDPRRLQEVAQQLQKRYESGITELCKKDDLELVNHLSGKQNHMIKISFGTVSEMMEVKQALRPMIQANVKRNTGAGDYYDEDEAEAHINDNKNNKSGMKVSDDPLVYLTEMREHDVPYHMRASIDLELRVGGWHIITPIAGSEVCNVEYQADILELCQPRVLAYDIECEKSPLKFPNAEVDRIYMISYMVAGQGYLLINREIVSADVDDFEYTQLPQYPGPFKVINLADEEATLRYFLNHIIELRPHVIVTYNGDFFDWPYVDRRCQKFDNLNMYKAIGIRATSGNGDVGSGEYTGRCIVHLDAFCWVQRDSYLPQGQQGLKAVTRSKLGYDPIEIDPEDMVRLAMEKPDHMAAYSVSDAVATYYLYTKYVHNFIFSLATIIPLTPEEVLRKGSGTLCEALLMVEAYRGNIICPNKQSDPITSFHEGHLLEGETYIGGHVECLEAGVFRADIPCKFSVVPSAVQGLIDHIDRDLVFALETENGVQRSDIVNYDEVRQGIVEKLEMLRDRPNVEEPPLILHIDVGAMYPNIILTNRLQPSAIVSQNDCAACDFNSEENQCQRKMTWTWRGDYSPANISEYNMHRRQLEMMSFPNPHNPGESVNFNSLKEADQAKIMKERLKGYSQRVYKKSKITKEEDRVDTVCQRENSFYVDTVRAFRDRRYEYKLATKEWKGKRVAADKRGDAVEHKLASDKEVLMDSLQLAHKCILNSFYGYVMRKGARWRSMEMAGIVTYTGAHLIMQARELVEQLGRPLELDTDGIWCILPSSFPQEYKMITKSGKKINIEYPAAMLNADVHDKYTNHQYQDLAPGGNKRYNAKSECSIYFELDGPYKAMVLPASNEEGKLLKKKYVVYNFDGSIAELKGFEIKRRGELELVKIFQKQVFDEFLSGSDLTDCYNAVGDVANQWLDILDSKGENINDEELMGYISEKKTISKTVEDYDGKSTSLTTAARLADFLGPEMIKDKGLNCHLIISKYPAGSPTTERAIPVAIFSADPSVRRFFLRKWLKDPTLDVEDFRNVVDWEYYKERLGKSIQKIITVPAGIQRVINPVPRVEHPLWLQRQVDDQAGGKKQMKLTSMFSKPKAAITEGYLVGGMPPPSRRIGTASKSSLRDRDRSPSKSRLGLTPTKGVSLSPARNIHGSPGAAVGSSPGSATRAQDRASSLKRKGHNLFGAGSPAGQEPIKDMEDMFNASPGGIGRPLVHRMDKTGAGNSAAVVEIVDEDVVPVPPIRDELPQSEADMNAWLKARSKTWKAIRTSKKKSGKKGGYDRNSYMAQLQADSNNEGARKKPLGVADMVKSAALAASYGHWQIIELQETDAPGEFVVWAMTQRTQLQRLRVIVPRTIYTNVHTSSAAKAAMAMGGSAVQKDLPHGRPMGKAGLYEIVIPEHKWARNEASMANFTSDPACEGVYESQVPLWLRGVLHLGCIARVNSSVGNNAQNKAYKLSDLESVNVISHPYLTSQTALFRRVYMYHCEGKAGAGGVAAIGVFIMESTNGDIDENETDVPLSGRAYVWFADGGRGSRDGVPSLSKLFRKCLKHLNLEEHEVDVKFNTMTVGTLGDAYKAASERIDAYLRERKGPTVVVAQGVHTPRMWRKHIPALREMPLLVMAANAQDSEFPWWGWQTYVAERMMQRFLIFPRWFYDRLKSSRFAGIPLCNLGIDAPTSIIDVTLSRQLIHNRHLLWASQASALPDIGGTETDLQSVWSEQLSDPVISNQGAYRNVCVELDLYGLAVCAIMSSGVLDAQGLTTIVTKTATDKQGSMTGQDESEGAEGTGGAAIFSDSSCARAFHLLKAMVTKWIDDVVREGEMGSESISYNILISLYRYLCGFGDALLYDPAIHRVVHGLMTKLFRRLVGEIGRLGATIIYADFSRIIIQTNKSDLKAAEDYVQYLVNAIRSKDTFLYVNLTPKNFYEQVLWLGPENFGAVRLTKESEAEKLAEYKKQVGDDDDDDDQEVEVDPNDDMFKAQSNDMQGQGGPVSESKGLTGAIELGSGMKKKKLVGFDDTVQVQPYNDRFDNNDGSEDMSDDDEFPKRSSSTGKGGEEGRELDFLFDNEDDNEYQAEDVEMDVQEDVLEEVEYPGQHMSWNLASYLPLSAAGYFRHIVSEYLLQYQKRIMQFKVKRDVYLQNAENSYIGPNNGDDDDGLAETNSYNGPIDDEGIREATVESMKGLLGRGFTAQMLDIVDDLVSGHPGHDQNGYFPKNAGSHLNFHSVALEFVKATMHVLALDLSLKEDVNNLRRLLLAHLKVKEFNDDSKFADPSLSYVLSDVICTYCKVARDIDLLRDSSVIDGDSTKRWHCQHCNDQLDKTEIENRLIDKAERLSTAYLLQDARCTATSMVSTKLTSSVSDMSKPLYLDTMPAKLRVQFGILMRVAEHHQFELLKCTISELEPSCMPQVM